MMQADRRRAGVWEDGRSHAARGHDTVMHVWVLAIRFVGGGTGGGGRTCTRQNGSKWNPAPALCNGLYRFKHRARRWRSKTLLSLRRESL